MDIIALQAFIAVARCKSFSKASESLFITQPAVSKRVAALEEEIETKLFNRISRQISLTESGRKLLPKAEELVNQADDMRRFASTLSDDIKGHLKIATSHHIGLRRLPPMLRKYNSLYDSVELDIRFGESEQACRDVERGEIELAIVTVPITPPKNLNVTTVWRDDLIIVAGFDHPLAGKKDIKIGDLLDHPCVFPDENTETYKIMRRVLSSNHSKLKMQMTTNNLEIIKMLVSTGFGWSLLPATMLDNELIRLNIDLGLYRNLGIVTHNKRSLSNAAKAMCDLLMTS